MTDVVFAYPDFESLGVGYLISACRAAGFTAALVRYQAEDPYTARSRRDFDPTAVAERMAALEPGVAAFSCVTHNFLDQLACARALKRLRPGVIVLFGGVHPTAVPARVLEHREIDAVGLGEAERSLVALLERARTPRGFRLPEGPIPGFARRDAEGQVLPAQEGPLADLDELPVPEKRAFHPDPDTLAREYFIMASRGCPYRCSYCFNSCIPRLGGRGGAVRRRSVESVIRELEAARREHGLRAVHFTDDSFTSDRSWVREFAVAYRARVGVPFLCSANPELVDAEAVEALRLAGCVEVQIGVQTLSRGLGREVLDRHVDPEAIASAVGRLRAAGLMVQVDLILGIPGDTLENQEAALAFFNRIRPHIVSVFWLAWYPGTTLLGRAVREGWLTAAQVDRVERGESISDGGLHTASSDPGAAPFLGAAALHNYLPLLPRWLVTLLLRTRLYRRLALRSYLFTTALPRVVRSLVDRRYFTGRAHLRRALRQRS
jgi:anaerobic magnesium-protoporphyrin IX monomethyl ester cyclase